MLKKDIRMMTGMLVALKGDEERLTSEVRAERDFRPDSTYSLMFLMRDAPA